MVMARTFRWFVICQDGGDLHHFMNLVCTSVYKAIDRKLAMVVGGANADPGQIRGRDWVALAKQAQVGAALVKRTVAEIAENIEPAAQSSAAAFRQQYGDSPIISQILTALRRQARRTRQLLGE